MAIGALVQTDEAADFVTDLVQNLSMEPEIKSDSTPAEPEGPRENKPGSYEALLRMFT